MDKSVATRIAKRFITLPLDKRTLYLEKMLAEGVSPANLPIPEVRSEFELIPLSFAQERQWFLWQLDPTSAAYHIPTALRLRGALDVPALEHAFNALVARHESLRTTFQQVDERAVQVIAPHLTLAVELLSLDAHLSDNEQQQQIKEFVEHETQQPFDLHNGPLLRVKLLRLADDDHVLVLTQHHIVSDGASMQIMVSELVQVYGAFVQGQDTTLAPLQIQYADYAIWQRHWMEAGERERQLAYWNKQLGGEQPVLELPTDYPRPAVQSFRGAKYSFELSAALGAALKKLAQQYNVTPFMILLASFQALLHRYSRQTDIRVGVPSANRNRVETEGLIGFFVNTQVLKADISPLSPFSDLLAQVKQTSLDAQTYQELPFEQLVEALHPERSLSHSPLFQVMFNHQNANVADHDERSRQLSGLTMEGLSWENPTAQFDLTLTTVENPQGFCGSFTYATDLFDPATIERMSRHWQCLLTAVVANPLQSVAQLTMLDAAQQQLILEEWNCSTVDYPRELRIHQLIENQAERLPNAIAIVFAEQRLTYQQLNSHANRLAGKLIELGVGPDVLVGIAVERSVEMIVGLLAVLKAGGAYVPLDPSYPEDRLAYMMQDSGVALLLTQSFVLPRMPVPHGVQTLILDQTKNWLEDYADVNPRQPLFPEHLAYAIYTSGSTGKPKGVMVPHGALSNFVASMTQAPGVSSQDRVLSLTTFSFDIFGLEIYVPLSIGARVVLTGQAINQDPDALLKLVHNEEVTVLQATPSTWRMLLDSPDSQALRGCKLLCGGEALPEELAQRMLALSDKVWNLYGPTETTIWSALHALDQAHAQPYLGRPIANTVLFLLDDDLGTVPIGVGAELLIGGEGLARGYFQRPALTAERFVPNPFGAPGERLYRTGDLTRYRNDGIIEYISRLDHQVKIRGFRIELGEIEARLLEHHDVREAAVLAQEGPGGTQLVAYLVPNSLSVESELRQTLKLHLKHGLADYMVPPHWVFLPTLPLTPNGKLDRKALPSPDADQLRKNYIAPQNEVERTVANIWAEVLKLDQVGMTDDFFELGGHSLLATRVVSRVRRALKCDVSLKSLFEHSELQAFVTALEASSSDHSQLIPQERGSSLPLSYAQERQWFLWQLDPDSAAYHIPAALRLKGELDIPALERSFSSLIERHESLRTTFILEGEHAVQVIAQATPLSIKLDTLVSINEPEQAIRKYVETQIQELFDLQSGPLLRVKLLQLATDDHVLIIVQHHIVSDAWSMQVMVRELIELYAGQSLGLNVTLPALPVQYADYAIWQRQWMNAGERERQLAYWSQQLGGEQTLLELPLDHPRPMEQSFRGAKVEFALSDTLSLSLKQLAKQLNVTPFMLLLASFQTLLHRYSRQSEICVGVPIANRNRLEIEGLIGFFVNTQVLKAIIDGQLPFSEFVQQVKRTALQAQAHQDLPFEHLVEALRPERALSHSPLFQVLFNHQNSGQLSKEHLTKLSVESLPWETQTAQFDLTLNTFESVDGFSAALTYATDLFEPATIERMVNHWQTLLHAIVKSPQKRIGELMLYTASDLQLTLEEWNPGITQYPATGCLHQLIETHAAHAPHAIALTLGTHQLSYEQLNTRANQLTHQLIEQGVGPDVMVGLASERSLEMVVGLLAILKAGGAYVPLDPAYPTDRLAYMIQDSGLTLVLMQAVLREQIPVPSNVRTLLLESDKLIHYSVENPRIKIEAENLAYVIYTSGSTGHPKGALLAHHNVLRLFSACESEFSFSAQDVWCLFHSYAFDFSVWEIFGALLYGGRLVIVPHEVSRSPEDFHALLCEQQVSVLNQTPSAFKQLMQSACETQATDKKLALRYVIFGGEALEIQSLRPWFEKFGDRSPQLINMYGITETTVHVTYRPINLADLSNDTTSPIGRPLRDLSWYLLDADLNPVAKGCIGELYVGGAGLARGYLNRTDLSATRFIADPFSHDGARLYRTGDLARYRADGVIEYIGRIDHQVKIRGFRIELGEIEAVLSSLEAVRQVVVLAQKGQSGQVQLVAYIVPSHTTTQDIMRETLKVHLKENLPDYMVPSHLLFLPQLPLTANGKLDRKALPSPDSGLLQQTYIAPRSEMEQRIAAIWQDVLKLERIGMSDNFFELGGDSIISIQVVSRARQAGIGFTPKELFQHQTIEGLARVAKVGTQAVSVDQGAVSGPALLLPIQQMFFETEIPERHHWNQSVLLKPNTSLQVGLLESALQVLIEHHDALRLVFLENNQGWQASFLNSGEVPAVLRQVVARDPDEIDRICTEAQRSLDLSKGPLLRALLIDLNDGSQRLLLAVHHLVVDGVSWRILFEDLQSTYQQLQNAQPLTLPSKTSSVQSWGERLRKHAHSDALRQQLPYWQEQLSDAAVALPCHDDTGSLERTHSRGVQTRLDAQLTRRLLQDAPAAYRTQINDLLLTALARVIARWTARPDCVIQLEGHGREDLFDDIDLTRTVGWFTSIFPVRLSTTDDLGESIIGVKEQLRRIPDKGTGYSALRYLGDERTRLSLSALPTPRLTFNYLGQFDSSFDNTEGALFAPCNDSAGAERSPKAPLDNWLSINGQVYGGELSLNWGFSVKMFNESTIKHLADDYADELKAIIEYCCNGIHSGVTPSDFPLAELSQQQLNALPVPSQDVEDIYPLSPMQQGILFHTQESPEAALYINQMSVPVEGLDSSRFINAWNSVIQHHEILRTGFWSSSDLAEPLQIIYRQASLPAQIIDWQNLAVSPQDLEQLAKADLEKGFDLLHAPLIRLTLIKLDEKRMHLIWTSHHILMDGWSSSRLLGEVFQIYNGQTPAAKRGSYRDYIQWLRTQSQANLETFWRGKLQGFSGPTSLTNSIAPRAQSDLEGHAALYMIWDTERTQHLREYAQRLRVTPNTLIQATWLLLLQRYTGQATVCFGATVAGRPASLRGADEMLGLFINTLPIIQTPEPTSSVWQWLQALQNYNLEIRDHEHASLADAQRWLGQGGTPLFDSIVVFENYPVDERLQEAEHNQLRFGKISTRDVTNFAMDLAINLGNTLTIEFLYLRNRFTPEATEQIRTSFETLLCAMLDNPDATLGSLNMLSNNEQQRLSQRNTLAPLQETLPLLAEVIRNHAVATPGAVAVVCAETQLSYGQLESRANRLAHHLIAQGIGPESFVGIALERSVDVIVAFYAVMKTGGAYVPLDIDYPQERVQWIVEDSAMSLLITHESLHSRFNQPWAPTLIALDGLSLDSQPDHCPASAVLDDNLAYLIYTSGSTGKPKGVAVSHGQIRMHCQAIARRYDMDANTRELLFMSFAFDGAQERWLSTLASGARLVVRDNRLWTPEETWQALHQHAISIACFPPAYLQQLAEFAQTQEQAPPPVRIYCFGGDAVADANFELVKRALKPQYLTNGYGPTETVVTPLLWKVPVDAVCGAVYAPIGKRVGERTLYVLDDALNAVPDGIAGELYIGGEGVARGYHQRPGLSAERFVADPFSTTGARLYRTGDLVRQRADGVIDYLGRLDNQVKIRGFRIEMGEIEARLRDLSDVQDAVVVARETAGGKQLIGYVVASDVAGLGERLRGELQQDLPDYMVPVQILVLERFPLNPNGKLDRHALPDPDFKGRQFIAPRNALEKALAAIWQEVLEVEQVGITDNFFELGGDSLRVLKVLSKVRSQPELGLSLKLRDMMGKPTIAELSGYTPSEQNLDPLLLLNNRVANAAPLFCLHAGFGTVFDYEPLARRLDGQRSVYGLQCRMLLDRDWEDESLQAMAIDYAQYIRQKQADGPYHLLGWSLGGPLALLVAQELESQGQVVEFVGLVDAFTPTAEQTQPEDDWSDDLRGFLAVIFDVAGERLPAIEIPAGSDIARLEQLIASVQSNVAGDSAYSSISTEELAHTFIVAMKLKALSAQLQILPDTSCRPHCWWASTPQADFISPVPGALSDELIAAGHYDILKNPDWLHDLLQQLPQNEAVTN